MTWRPSTRGEIAQYYEEEFGSRLQDLPEYITPTGPREYALAFREAYPAKGRGDRDFIRRATWATNNSTDTKLHPYFEDWNDLLAFIRDPAGNDPLRDHSANSGLADPETVDDTRPVPTAVYYHVRHWDRNWLVPVDIDAKDVAFERALRDATPRSGEPKEEFLERVGIIEEDPEGYQYAFEDLEQALVYGFAVRDIFEESLNASDTQVYYTGQGCHVYLLDDDADHRYDQGSREVLVEFLETEYDLPIDSVVTADDARVMRLPFSLHAGVSRVVTPVESPDYDFREDAKPACLSDDESAETAP